MANWNKYVLLWPSTSQDPLSFGNKGNDLVSFFLNYLNFIIKQIYTIFQTESLNSLTLVVANMVP